jgi:hypothetical protein
MVRPEESKSIAPKLAQYASNAAKIEYSKTKTFGN